MKMNNSFNIPNVSNISNNGPKFDVQMLKMFLPKITQQDLANITEMAKQMGMSDQQIQAGINQLNQLRN